jgi:hypothetical protein
MKIAFLSVFFLPLMMAAQIGAKVQQQGKIHGLWQNSQFGYQMTLILNADGSGEFDGEMIKFTSQGTKLSIVQGNQSTVYSYTLQGNSLALSGGDLEGVITFTRSDGTEQTSMIAADPIPTSKNSNSAADGGLTGVWSGNGETIEFKPDGKCVYIGNTFSYEISQGNLILITAQGNVVFAYAINGNQLNLSANGQQITYMRGGNNSPIVGNAKSASGGEGIVAQELVGKWCYMNNSLSSSTNKCITLNADGTYIYNSESSRSVNTTEVYGGTASQGADRGTWYMQGDRLYYNSQTQGQGSYRLEKRNHPKNASDPMIVLDGEAYVTAILKSPWR